MGSLVEVLPLACPLCHGVLMLDDGPAGGGAACTACAREYQTHSGAIDFTPNPPPDPDVRERWPLWERLEHSLSVGPRPDARAFAEFARLEGIVLDVGCGTQPNPSYATEFAGTFVGIDPVRGAPERAFAFVQGLGEYLPFADASFDRVLFATSLDHMLSPRRALAEARRVLRRGGSMSIWFGEVREPPPPPPLRVRMAFTVRHPLKSASLWRRRLKRRPSYERELEVPEGAIDLFHVVHLDRRLVGEWLRQTGWRVTDVERLTGHASVFLRAEPSP
jgi:SAM-dependent methyltransferase